MARLLVVEDSPTQARRLALILEDAGFEVETAPDADRGFASLGRAHFDLVLSDLLLPGDSGFDLCRRLKADPRYRHLPVVVHTSQADPANVLRGLEAGADDFMTKDREPAAIVHRLRRALARGPRSATSARAERTPVIFREQKFELAATREQLLDVLVSAFEDVVQLNDRSLEANNALAERNRQLQQLANDLAASVLSERQAHEELRLTHEELKKTQSQLVQSEKLASLGQLAAGMAHEINNPIAIVTNNLAVLRRDALALLDVLEKYRQGWARLTQAEPDLAAEVARLEKEMDLLYLQANLSPLFDHALDGLHRVRDIVRNLRDFARLDEAEWKDADLNAALTSTIEVLRHELEQKGIQLQTCFEELPLVLCHPGKINQVFLSLLLNAIQACAPGGTIQVRTQYRVQGSAPLAADSPPSPPPAPEGAALPEAVVIEFEDNGCGILPEHLPHIFEPFFTTKTIGQGKGLGLSVSYGIIHDHDGTIGVESTPGRGSLFRVRLPLRSG